MTDPVRQAAQDPGPTLTRFLERHPGLREHVEGVLTRAAEVREAKARAFEEGIPEPVPSPAHRRCTVELETAVATLAALAESAAPKAMAVDAAVTRVLRAVAELRAESHAFSPRRRTTSASRRARLVSALTAFRSAFAGLESEAHAQHVRRLPWQLELATQVAPDTPVEEMEVTGHELPDTPVGRRPWGERCTLTGRPFHTDRHRAPALRHRSLDSLDQVFSPEAFELLRRLRHALEVLRGAFPEAAAGVARLLPALFEEHVLEGCHPSFAKLGLLDFPSLAVSLSNMLRRYGPRPLFGRRGSGGRFPTLGLADREAVARGGATTGYVWDTYDEIRDLALRLAHGLEGLGLSPGARLGILTSRNDRDFYLGDFAAVFARLVCVGLHDKLSAEQLATAARQAELEAVVTDGASAEKLLAPEVSIACPSLRLLVVCGDGAQPRLDGGLRVARLEELVASLPPQGWRSASGVSFDTPLIFGDAPGYDTAREHGIPEDGDDELYTLVFTSGTTGRPKGTPVSRRRWAEEMCGEADLWPNVAVSFQPSAIAADRGLVWQALYNGGRVGFARRGAELFDDVRAIRPTKLDVPPVIWNAIYTEYKRAVTEPGQSREQTAAVRRRFRDFLGGRVAFMASGGAASDAGVCQCMEAIFGVPMSEGYGATETGQIAVDERLLPGLDYRLVDRPDLGFTRADQPFPRGELAVRTPLTATRYHGDEESTRDGFTSDGYFLTGDLVELGPDRRCRILGRRKHLFKLAGAEFVSPQLLEGHFNTSESVEAVLVTGSPTRSHVVVVAVPASDDRSESEILAELQAIARREGLPPLAVPAAVLLAPRVNGRLPWSAANGLLTSSHKLNRPALEARYREPVEALYARLEQARGQDDGAGDVMTTDLESATSRLRRLAATLLSREEGDIDLERSFRENGGDSLTSMDFVLRLEQVFAGKATADAAWRNEAARLATTPLRELARRVSGGSAGPSPPPVAPAASGPAPAIVSRSESEVTSGPSDPEALAELANDDAGSAPAIQAGTPPSSGQHVFVTGGTGFLGTHLLAHLAQTLEAGRRVYALVRARDDGAARQRLLAAFRKASLPVPAVGVPARPKAARVLAVAGSIEEDRLGLSPQLWELLAHELGIVYHVAAQVSGGLDYAQLRGSNVLGTRRVLELVTSATLKPLHFVSSLNVALMSRRRGGLQAFEETPLPESVTPQTFAAHPHYAITKWASEQLIQRLYARAAGTWCVSVSRPALISWSAATGVANDSDWLPRVLASCLQMRSAIGPDESGVPEWVAETATSARGVELVPVDFVARSVARLGQLTEAASLPPPTRPGADERVPTFHVSNLAPGEQGLVTGRRLMDLLVAADLRVSSAGGAGPLWPIEQLPRTRWLLEAELQATPVLPITDQLKNMQPSFARSQTRRFAAALGPERCPPVDLELVETYVRRERGTRPGPWKP